MEEEVNYDDESLEGVLKKSDKVVMDFLRHEVYYIMEQADMNKKIFVAFMNTIMNEIERRLEERAKHEC